MRLFVRVGFAATILCAIVFAGSPKPVVAHAGLKASEPAASAVLEESPEQIRLTFGEAVEISFGSIRLFDADSRLIVLPTPQHAIVDSTTNRQVVQVRVPELEPGSYLVVWRVVSTDSHPVQGAFGFQIGTRGSDLGRLQEDILASSSAPASIRMAMGMARWLTFLGVMVLVGSMLLSTRIIGDSRVDRIIWASWFASAIGSVLVYFLQAPYALGKALGIGEIFGLADEVFSTRLGIWLVIRGFILLAIGAMIWRRDLHRQPVYRVLSVLIATGLFATFSISGHPGMRQFSALSIGTDIVHFMCVSAWMGGLVTMILLGRRWQAESPQVISWFSFTATITMPIMVATGVAQAWRMMDGLQNIFSTSYGVVLSVKVALVLVAIGAGAKARQVFKSKKVDSQDLTKLRFSRTIAVEGAIGVVVLAATAVLVSVPPLSVNSAEPFAKTLVQANVIADVTITPARVGEVELHVVFSPPGGALQSIQTMTAQISTVDGEIPPIPVEVELAGTNHFQGRLLVPRAGEWLLELFVRPTGNETLRFSQVVAIKGE
ncbi:MAG: copper resistance CopC/CopD family protein [Actinomycetota bacterium]